MASICLQNLSIDFPVFTSRSRGLLNTMFRYARKEQDRIEAAGFSRFHVHALRDINLSLRAGERLGIVGRNGAGKTTLLRVLSGVYEPTAGSLQITGSASSLTDIMLGMDMDASGYDNIVLRCIVMGLSRKQARDLIPDIEEFTELGDYLNLPVRAYSQGMLLRLALAVSTSVTPDILLMDEMIGAGDAQFVQKSRKRINGLIGGVSILVLASHNENILREFCDTGLLLHEGRIIHHGPMEDCLARYAETTTANTLSRP